MSRSAIVEKLEKDFLKTDIVPFGVGDTVRVHTRIIEGQKERIQVFTGTVIAKQGKGLSETFTLHRVANGEGMVRVFPLHSPRIATIEVTKRGHVRRAKLNYLKGKSGKATKIREKFGARKAGSQETATA